MLPVVCVSTPTVPPGLPLRAVLCGVSLKQATSKEGDGPSPGSSPSSPSSTERFWVAAMEPVWKQQHWDQLKTSPIPETAACFCSSCHCGPFAERLIILKACCCFDSTLSTGYYLCHEAEFYFHSGSFCNVSSAPVGHSRPCFSHAWAFGRSKAVIIMA